MCVWLCVDLWTGELNSEAMAAGLCLQEEGGRVKERCREEEQHLGSTHLQEGPGKTTPNSTCRGENSWNFLQCVNRTSFFWRGGGLFKILGQVSV